MILFASTLRALAPLFLLILLGVILKRKGFLSHAHPTLLNALVIRITLPALVFLSLIRAPQLPADDGRLPAMLWLAEAVTMALALLVCLALRVSKAQRGAIMMTGVFGNTAFLGYPITLSLLPSQFPAAVLLDEVGCGLMMYIAAACIGAAFGAGGDPPLRAIGRFLRSPLFLSVAAGLAVRALPIPSHFYQVSGLIGPGRIIGECLGYLAQGTTPLILLSLGASLSPRAAFAKPVLTLLPCALKLAACPLLMGLICRAFGVTGDAFRIGVLQAAMPTSVMTSMLCIENHLEGSYAVGIVFAGTLLAALTLPITLALIR